MSRQPGARRRRDDPRHRSSRSSWPTTPTAGCRSCPPTSSRPSVPNGAQLVAGNEIREGGNRIGTVTEIRPSVREDGTHGRRAAAAARRRRPARVPADSTIRIRPRSALGLKYVELQRGDARATRFAEGATITRRRRTRSRPSCRSSSTSSTSATRRERARRNLNEFGSAFAGRGVDLNRAFESPPALPRGRRAGDATCSRDPATRLGRVLRRARGRRPDQRPARRRRWPTASAPERTPSRRWPAIPAALQETITETPPTLDGRARTALRNTRPFLRSLAEVSDDLRLAAAELRRSAPPLRAALRVRHRPAAADVPALNRRLDGHLRGADRRSRSRPAATPASPGSTETMTTLTPADALPRPATSRSATTGTTSGRTCPTTSPTRDQTGQVQRIRAKMAIGRRRAASARSARASRSRACTPSPTARRSTPAATADCEQGQRGYPTHLANGIDPSRELVGDADHPRRCRAPTFTGRPRVPAGQTFSALAEGAARHRPGGTCGHDATSAPACSRSSSSSIGTYLGLHQVDPVPQPLRDQGGVPVVEQPQARTRPCASPASRSARSRRSSRRARARSSAIVTMRINDKGRPIHADATAKIRPRIFLEGNFFVDLTAGSPGAPELGDGDVHPGDADRHAGAARRGAQGARRRRAREPAADARRARRTPSTPGLADEFNRSLPDQAPGLQLLRDRRRGAARAAGPHDLSDAIRDVGTTAAALDRSPARLQSLLANFNITARALAVEDDAWPPPSASCRARSPPPARRSTASTRPSRPPAASRSTALPGVRSSRPAVAALRPLVAELDGLVGEDELRGLSRDLRGATPGPRPAQHALAAAVAPAAPARLLPQRGRPAVEPGHGARRGVPGDRARSSSPR